MVLVAPRRTFSCQGSCWLMRLANAARFLSRGWVGVGQLDQPVRGLPPHTTEAVAGPEAGRCSSIIKNACWGTRFGRRPRASLVFHSCVPVACGRRGCHPTAAVVATSARFWSEENPFPPRYLDMRILCHLCISPGLFQAGVGEQMDRHS